MNNATILATLGHVGRQAIEEEPLVELTESEKQVQAWRESGTTDPRTPAEMHFDRIVAERRAKGRATYGKGLDHTDESYDYTHEALEEAMDGGQYLAAENLRLLEENAILKAILPAVEPMVQSYAQSCRRLAERMPDQYSDAARACEVLHEEILKAIQS